LKDKINELESDSKNKNIRDPYTGISEFKKGYQPRTNLVKDKRGDQLADPQKELLSADGVRQTEIHTAELCVLEPSASEVEVTIRKLKRYKLPGSDQIPTKLIQVGRGDFAF
jgi:hypothetical protein